MTFNNSNKDRPDHLLQGLKTGLLFNKKGKGEENTYFDQTKERMVKRTVELIVYDVKDSMEQFYRS